MMYAFPRSTVVEHAHDASARSLDMCESGHISVWQTLGTTTQECRPLPKEVNMSQRRREPCPLGGAPVSGTTEQMLVIMHEAAMVARAYPLGRYASGRAMSEAADMMHEAARVCRGRAAGYSAARPRKRAIPLFQMTLMQRDSRRAVHGAWR
jgi:hypothetical protein